MPASSSLSASRATSFFDRSPETAVSFVPSPALHAHLSSFDTDSTVLHDLHEAWPDTDGVRNHIPAAGVELEHLPSRPSCEWSDPRARPVSREGDRDPPERRFQTPHGLTIFVKGW